MIGLRVTETEELSGLDASQHGETAYVFAEEIANANAAVIYEKDDNVGIENAMAATPG